jgi:hypothetical protein
MSSGKRFGCAVAVARAIRADSITELTSSLGKAASDNGEVKKVHFSFEEDRPVCWHWAVLAVAAETARSQLPLVFDFIRT